jgi:Holliday junction resolvase RusA-like endonuclease
MIDITIEAPLPPRGKGRPRATVRGGHAAVYSPAETVRWEAMLAGLAASRLPQAQIEGPIRVDVLAAVQRPQRLLARWARPRPGGHGYGTWQHPLGLLWRAAKPDADNVRKAVLDALKAFWRDDSMVVSGDTLSCFSEAAGRPRVVVRIRSETRDPNDVVRDLGLLALYAEGR